MRDTEPRRRVENIMPIKNVFGPGRVAHTYNPRAWEAEIGDLMKAQGQFGLQSKFQIRLCQPATKQLHQ